MSQCKHVTLSIIRVLLPTNKLGVNAPILGLSLYIFATRTTNISHIPFLPFTALPFISSPELLEKVNREWKRKK